YFDPVRNRRRGTGAGVATEVRGRNNRAALFQKGVSGQNQPELHGNVYLPNLQGGQACEGRNRATENVVLHISTSAGAVSAGRTGNRGGVRLVCQDAAR